MKNKMIIWLVLTAMVASLVSCNSLSGQTNEEVGTLVAIQVAQTQLAATLNAVAEVKSPTAQPLLLEPSSSPTITLTPEPSFTPTAEGVWLTVNENTNCRSGPGMVYDLITTIQNGTHIQATGVNPTNEYYYVRNPDGSGFCWLWDKYSSVTGNIGALPVFTPQPTPTITPSPTPAADFQLTYKSLITCAPQYAVNLKIVNTGSITWKSVSITIKDTVTSTTVTHTLDAFRGYNNCALDMTQSDLMPGESGVVSNVNPGQFNHNPTGHKLKITVTLYSKDGLTGKSVTKSITVTP